MEPPQALPNLWIILRTIGWIMALEGVAEFFSDSHSFNLFRRLIYLFVERDPFLPRPPDNWEEWYNS
jgi:hypothetical protein